MAMLMLLLKTDLETRDATPSINAASWIEGNVFEPSVAKTTTFLLAQKCSGASISKKNEVKPLYKYQLPW